MMMPTLMSSASLASTTAGCRVDGVQDLTGQRDSKARDTLAAHEQFVRWDDTSQELELRATVSLVR